ncbi:MAG: prepilin-type N-terminal cleavage/methylation domain-containing protein [bacterium]|nr:prepilin-type N-terminal cleavage/methylation domain-containing protein [bacterium]
MVSINSKVNPPAGGQKSKLQVKIQNFRRSSFELLRGVAEKRALATLVTNLSFVASLALPRQLAGRSEFWVLSLRRRSGFTLIEAMSVVAIIGILASLSMYAYTSATSRSRDARRKSDLTAISLGFQARYDAKACSNASDVGFYPGRRLGWSAIERWKSTEVLRTLSDDCGSYSEYLATIPTDTNILFPYRFDLSDENGVIGKHYRLTAQLEKTPLNTSEQTALERAEIIWQDSFGGAPLPEDYNYIIGN